MTYELFQQGPSIYIPIILLNLVVTLFSYAAFPIIFAAVRNSPITKKKYRGLCYGINAIVMLIFIIIGGDASTGAPYLLWTLVFSSLGTKILGTRGIMSDSEYLKDDPNRMTECKSCGYRDKQFFNACPKCGKYAKQYVYLNNETTSNITLENYIIQKCEEFKDNEEDLNDFLDECLSKDCINASQYMYLQKKYIKNENTNSTTHNNSEITSSPNDTTRNNFYNGNKNKSSIQLDGNVIFCRKCGEKILSDSAFCYKCGAKVETPIE